LQFLRRTIRRGRERLKSRIGVDGLFREFGDDLPLRTELFSVNQLERLAEALAQWHEIACVGSLWLRRNPSLSLFTIALLNLQLDAVSNERSSHLLESLSSCGLKM
jgi:hypothetical protein